MQPQRTARPCTSARAASPHTAGLQDQSTETQSGRRPVLDAPAAPLAECPRTARTCHPLRLLWGGSGDRAGTQGLAGLHLGPGHLLARSPRSHTLTSLRITFLLEAFLGSEPRALRTSSLSVPQGLPKGRSSLVPGQPVLGAEMSSPVDKPPFCDNEEVSAGAEGGHCITEILHERGSLLSPPAAGIHKGVWPLTPASHWKSRYLLPATSN